MSTDPKNLLDSCLEIEGLLALVVVRGGHCSTETFELLKSKVTRLRDEIYALQPSAAEAPEQTLTSDIEIADDVEIVDPVMPEESTVVEEQVELSKVDVIEPVVEVKPEPVKVEPVRVEPTAPKTTNDSLSALFSINDKFLYCRELFGSSREEMNEALDVISNMSSADEVEDYLFNDLCLDSQNETVQSFLAAMSSRFPKK